MIILKSSQLMLKMYSTFCYPVKMHMIYVEAEAFYATLLQLNRWPFHDNLWSVDGDIYSCLITLKTEISY